jgi:hypothetical protein
MTSFVALAALAAVVGCTEPACRETDTLYTSTVDVASKNGTPLARVDLAQVYKTNGPSGCNGEPLETVGIVTGTVTGTAPAAVTISYEIQGLNAEGVPVGAYPDSLPRVEPGASVPLGDLMTTTAPLSGGARVVLKSYAAVP